MRAHSGEMNNDAARGSIFRESRTDRPSGADVRRTASANPLHEAVRMAARQRFWKCMECPPRSPRVTVKPGVEMPGENQVTASLHTTPLGSLDVNWGRLTQLISVFLGARYQVAKPGGDDRLQGSSYGTTSYLVEYTGMRRGPPERLHGAAGGRC